MLGEFCIPSLEIAGPGGHWVEVSRALGTPNAEVARMLEAYEEYFEAAKTALRPGATAHDVHRAVSKGFTDRGYHLGHVTGHSIGMTMIEHPKIGEGIETELAREHGLLDASARRSPRTGGSASTCRTRGSSPPTAASRSRNCRCASFLRPLSGSTATLYGVPGPAAVIVAAAVQLHMRSRYGIGWLRASGLGIKAALRSDLRNR